MRILVSVIRYEKDSSSYRTSRDPRVSKRGKFSPVPYAANPLLVFEISGNMFETRLGNGSIAHGRAASQRDP